MAAAGRKKTVTEVKLWERLHILERIKPLDDTAKWVFWHRIDEIRRALDLKPLPPPPGKCRIEGHERIESDV